ncbi:MAG: glycerophosphodiester phosphodiesterase family protein [Pseudomonadota bacterium]
MTTLEELITTETPLVVAHRGASGSAPENTAAAITLALAAGARMMEIDVQISRDGEVVVFHDSTLERTSSGTGKICDFTYRELSGLDAGSWFGEEFAGEQIPRLIDLFSLVKGKACLNVEIKPPTIGEDWRKRIDLIAAITRKAAMASHTLFSSFHHDSLRYLQSLEGKFHTAALLMPDSTLLPSDILKQTGCEGFVCSLDQLTPERIADIAGHNIFTGVYTINSEKELQKALRAHVNAVVTDFPELMMRLLRGKSR